MSVFAHLLAVAMMIALTACASVGPREPVQFAGATRPAGSEDFPNWVTSPDEAMRLMTEGAPEVEDVVRTATGTSGAEKVELRISGTEFRLKSKEVPPDLDGINNAPRKELAAYALQSLFLDPEDYVVPATSLRCIPLALRQPWHQRKVVATVSETNCVLLVLAMWLRDVTLPEVVLDRGRFLSEPSYAYYMSNLNIFTFLVEHQDGREGNFLISKDDRRQVFAIDNGVSFGQPWPYYNWFVPNWNVLRVPAVRKDTIDRLRALERSDLDFLLVVAQLDPRSTRTREPADGGPHSSSGSPRMRSTSCGSESGASSSRWTTGSCRSSEPPGHPESFLSVPKKETRDVSTSRESSGDPGSHRVGCRARLRAGVQRS